MLAGRPREQLYWGVAVGMGKRKLASIRAPGGAPLCQEAAHRQGAPLGERGSERLGRGSLCKQAAGKSMQVQEQGQGLF